jgi:hypothetical protein
MLQRARRTRTSVQRLGTSVHNSSIRRVPQYNATPRLAVLRHKAVLLVAAA